MDRSSALPGAGEVQPSAQISRPTNGWTWALAFSALVIASRGPAILSSVERNVDESLMLAQALRYEHDLVPWRSVDGVTSGPLNSWVLLAAHKLGMRLHYREAHVLAALLQGWIVAAGYWHCRRQFGHAAAIVAAGSATVWFACNQHVDFTHYSSELVPIALIGAALVIDAARPASRFWQTVCDG